MLSVSAGWEGEAHVIIFRFEGYLWLKQVCVCARLAKQWTMLGGLLVPPLLLPKAESCVFQNSLPCGLWIRGCQ